MHGGRPKVSPTRFNNSVELAHRATGQHLIVVNTHMCSTHMIASAWNNKHTRDDPYRMAMWKKHERSLKRRVAELRDAKGLPVFVVGHDPPLGDEPAGPPGGPVAAVSTTSTCRQLRLPASSAAARGGAPRATRPSHYGSDHAAYTTTVVIRPELRRSR